MGFKHLLQTCQMPAGWWSLAARDASGFQLALLPREGTVPLVMRKESDQLGRDNVVQLPLLRLACVWVRTGNSVAGWIWGRNRCYVPSLGCISTALAKGSVSITKCILSYNMWEQCYRNKTIFLLQTLEAQIEFEEYLLQCYDAVDWLSVISQCSLEPKPFTTLAACYWCFSTVYGSHSFCLFIKHIAHWGKSIFPHFRGSSLCNFCA